MTTRVDRLVCFDCEHEWDCEADVDGRSVRCPWCGSSCWDVAEFGAEP